VESAAFSAGKLVWKADSLASAKEDLKVGSRNQVKRRKPRQRGTWGGWRPNSGRKVDLVKRKIAELKPATAAELLAAVDGPKLIRDIFTKGSLQLRQKTYFDLMDRVYGRPTESVRVQGSLTHWTPTLLANLSDAEVAVLAKIVKRPELTGTIQGCRAG
jgi:hypothetical protein